MNLKSRIKIFFIIFMFLMMILTIKTSAVSISLSTSSSSVSAGESFTATVTGNDATGKVYISVSNGTASISSGWVENDSFSFTVTAGSSGTVNITASGELSSSSAVDENVSASASVSIASSAEVTTSETEETAAVTATTSTATSTSAPTLYNLGIDPYDFSGFSSNVTSYSVTVPNECTSVSIYAYSKNGTVTGTGTVTLSEGTNKFTVTVSNNSGSTAYTISIIRETLEGDGVANVIDDETEETNSEGIGLAGLTITGYTLEPEFDISTYEYTVTVDEELTLELLEEIKSKITAITNTDSVYTEITANISEDEVATITIIVKDDEKEYSAYIIYFEQEEAEVVSVAGVTSANDLDETLDMEELTKKAYVIMACMLVSVFIAMHYAINSYQISKALKTYDIENYDEDEDEEANFEELVQNFKEKELSDSSEENNSKEFETVASESKGNASQSQTDFIEIKDSREYKKPRKNNGSGGKH